MENISWKVCGGENIYFDQKNRAKVEPKGWSRKAPNEPKKHQ